MSQSETSLREGLSFGPAGRQTQKTDTPAGVWFFFCIQTRVDEPSDQAPTVSQSREVPRFPVYSDGVHLIHSTGSGRAPLLGYSDF